MAPRRNPKRGGGDDDGDRLTNKRAMAYGGGAEGRSTEGEVEEEYPQKETAMDTMERIMEREHQFETRSTHLRSYTSWRGKTSRTTSQLRTITCANSETANHL